MGRVQEEAREEFFRTTGGLVKKLAFRWGGNVEIVPDEAALYYHNSRLREDDPDKPPVTHTHEDGTTWEEPGGTRRRKTLMARYISKNMLVINGAGFGPSSGETAEQTRIRADAGRWQLGHPERHVLLVPFPALESGGVDLSSARPIHIMADRFIDTFQEVGTVPDILNNEAHRKQFICTDPASKGGARKKGQLPAKHDTGSASGRETWEGTFEGIRWRVTYIWRHRHNRNDPSLREGGWEPRVYEIWMAPPYMEPDWTGVRSFMKVDRERRPHDDPFTGGDDPKRFIAYSQTWADLELYTPPANRVDGHGRPVVYGAFAQSHRLGNSVFSAKDAMGKRHRYISGFDDQEPRPMYFFAQLPDRGRCKTYEEAIELLKPEIVRRAEVDGRHVVRQGDIFAVETTLTTEQVYKRSIARVRRSIALQPRRSAYTAGTGYQEPRVGEVHVVDACPTCGHHGMRVGNGPRARRALSIHGTGHTATEVVVCKGGVTFARGIMHHDPQIEDSTRTPEHRNFDLARPEHIEAVSRMGMGRQGVSLESLDDNPDIFKWYLCVRNTVPRQKRPITDVTQERESQTTQRTSQERRAA